MSSKSEAIGAFILFGIGIIGHLLNEYSMGKLHGMGKAVAFLGDLLWKPAVVFGGSLLLLGFGVNAMYSGDYIIAIPFYVVAVSWATAKLLTWEQTRHERGAVSFLCLITAGLLCWWILHVEGIRSGGGFMQVGEVHFADMPIAAGNRFVANVGIKNAGSTAVDNVYRYFEMTLTPITEHVDEEWHPKFLSHALAEQADSISKGNRGVTVGSGHGIWNTLTVPKQTDPPLAPEMAQAIRDNKYRLYVYVWSRWKDSPHDLDACRWVQIPPDGYIRDSQIYWHVCEDWH